MNMIDNTRGFYYTVYRDRIERGIQVTLDDILAGVVPLSAFETKSCNINTNTVTYYIQSEAKTTKLWANVEVSDLVEKLIAFNARYKALHETEDRHQLYRTFYIPKASGGLRKIDAPNRELMGALRELRSFLENDCHILYHTSAFAYIKNRSTIESIKRHQSNDSKWFLKTDFSNFFGSTTTGFLMSMLSKIYPLNFICASRVGRQQLEKAISLAMLDGGLPQGTPISPTLTNIMMIPIDHYLSNHLRKLKTAFSDKPEYFVYTRYADDILITCKYGFKYTDVVAFINDTLDKFGAPFKIKPEKTRYGSRSGSNWNLGVMLNRDNQITVGHETKKKFKAELHSFIMSYKYAHTPWDLESVQQFAGRLSYYKMVEKPYFDYVIGHYNQKFNIDFETMLKAALNGKA